ncbi:integrin alpha-PS2-like [Daphnia carinata]|uniref:integrin alpha-PS2-like n=1 Tax=Daphnia carinata TaxID=120202 RepID=UPI002580EE3C|nr:integrin alpha-PS2-like [Daphnia carinata]
MRRCIRLVAVLISIAICANGFNLDVKFPLKASGTQNSYFGYSLAVHEHNADKWLLVGAPKELTLSSEVSGALHQCQQQEGAISCKRVKTFPPDIEAADQWLGASVVSRNGTAMVCAPRTGEKVAGQCFYGQENLPSFTSYMPWNEAFCEVGFSATLSSDGKRFYTGGPSCELNAGRLIASTGPDESNPDLLSGDLAFYSYAIAAGNVLSNKREGLVVSIGFHQNSNFSGKVVLIDSLAGLQPIGSLIGYQSGEHFGASLAVFDINADGRDDIFIGAPHHTDYGNSEIKFDVGAVYVYYQTSEGLYKRGSPNEFHHLKGEKTGAQFGFAMAELGDTNGDGFKDLAVGAPYENDGSGAVYIYHGSQLGLQNPPGQVIYGHSFNPPIRSFGFSFITGGNDFDRNAYSDLIAGAYLSDIVVHLPARPVVKVKSKISFAPTFITLEKKECQVLSATTDSSPVAVSCAKLQYCLVYGGTRVPSNINTNITITLDVTQPKANRLLFMKTNNNQLTQIIGLTEKTQLCQEEMVYVRPDIRDKLSKMEVTLVATLVETPEPLSAILDIYEGKGFSSNSLSILINCGPDSICIPDLQMEAIMTSETYIQGSDERWTIDVVIYNNGEDAFGADFYLHLPSSLGFINTDKEYTDQSVLCFPPGEINGLALRCEVGNPLPSNKTARLRVILRPTPGDDAFVSFLAETNSTNAENDNTKNDNSELLKLTFKAETKLALRGWSRPEALVVNMTALKMNEDTALPHYAQFYEVQNVGPSDVTHAKFRIVIPTHTLEGYAISELTAQPNVTEGKAHCDPVQLKPNPNVGVINIDCVTEKMTNRERVVIRLNSRLSSEALLKQLNTDIFTLRTVVTANITGLPYGQDVSQLPIVKTEVLVDVTKITKELNVLKAMPWWVPFISAIVAVLIVAIITGVLHHFGIFKRNRPMPLTATLASGPESQPLQETGENPRRPMSEIDNMVDEESS